MATDVGRIGVWCSSRSWPADPAAAAEAAAELEELGYQALWLGMSAGNLALSEALLAATSRMAVATGIANVWDTPPAVVAAGYQRVSDARPGRFLLGLGASHAHVVERGGGTHVRPYAQGRQVSGRAGRGVAAGPGRRPCPSRARAAKCWPWRAAGPLARIPNW
jgi:probable F420-dependent oxidoreductase